MRNNGYEGRNIIVIGSAGYTANPTEVYTLYNYEDADKKLQPKKEEKTQPETEETTETKVKLGINHLKNTIKDIFSEGKPLNPTDTFGLNQVYAINIGPDATIDKLLTALETSETLYDVDIEVFPKLSNIPALNLIKGHLKKLGGFGDYRIALATTPSQTKVEDLPKITDPNSEQYISSGRVVLHVDSNMLGFFAAKVACTPYFIDPAYGPYRTVTPTDIPRYRRDELQTLIDAGLVVDWPVVDPDIGIRVVEPVHARATNFTVEKTPADAYLHQRLNADHQSKVTDDKARKYIKQNNTETTRQEIIEICKAYLQGEVPSRINGFSYELYPSLNDPYGLIVKMSILPVKSIHTIEINRVIQV
jgi:hypothetical protein